MVYTLPIESTCRQATSSWYLDSSSLRHLADGKCRLCAFVTRIVKVKCEGEHPLTKQTLPHISLAKILRGPFPPSDCIATSRVAKRPRMYTQSISPVERDRTTCRDIYIADSRVQRGSLMTSVALSRTNTTCSTTTQCRCARRRSRRPTILFHEFSVCTKRGGHVSARVKS